MRHIVTGQKKDVKAVLAAKVQPGDLIARDHVILRRMPRHNRTPKHQPYQPAGHQVNKKCFASKAAAQAAIIEIQKYQLDLQLRAYQSLYDGGWYLTSQADTSQNSNTHK